MSAAGEINWDGFEDDEKDKGPVVAMEPPLTPPKPKPVRPKPAPAPVPAKEEGPLNLEGIDTPAAEAALAKMSEKEKKKRKALDKILANPTPKLPPLKHLRDTFTGFDGQEHPLRLRGYQVQGVLHLAVNSQFVLGDDTGLGKTLQSIAALCRVWEDAPDTKAVILTTKTATPQWAGEFSKFTSGITVVVCAGSAKKREAARQVFVDATGPTVIIMGYGAVRRDMTALQHWTNYILVADEITAVKNPKTQVHQIVKHMASQASRTWGLTATLIKNHLMEGYGIYKVVAPDLFPQSAEKFMTHYCLVRMQRLPKSNRQVPIIVGYTPEKIAEFKRNITPFFLGRPKHEVASDLPNLVMKQIEVGLNRAQKKKYAEALEGLLEMGRDDDAVLQETTQLTQIIYCQEIVNHLDLIDCDGGSEKLDALLDLLTSGDLEGEKVIVYTRFSKMVDLLMPALKKAKVPAVRITGAEKLSTRQEAMAAFQDPNSDTKVVCITMAAGDAINLQAAKAIVFFDTPWSAGDFIQIVGRMIRIGSVHDRCYAIHLIARDKKPTIDSRVVEVMHKKMKLIEAVIGRRLKGEQDPTAIITVDNEISDLFDMLRDDALEVV